MGEDRRVKPEMKRFGEVVSEIDGIKATCPDCGTPLVKPPDSTEGIGRNATLPMLYCESCGEYIMSWRTEHGDQ